MARGPLAGPGGPDEPPEQAPATAGVSGPDGRLLRLPAAHEPQLARLQRRPQQRRAHLFRHQHSTAHGKKRDFLRRHKLRFGENCAT